MYEVIAQNVVKHVAVRFTLVSCNNERSTQSNALVATRPLDAMDANTTMHLTDQLFDHSSLRIGESEIASCMTIG